MAAAVVEAVTVQKPPPCCRSAKACLAGSSLRSRQVRGRVYLLYRILRCIVCTLASGSFLLVILLYTLAETAEQQLHSEVPCKKAYFPSRPIQHGVKSPPWPVMLT